MDEARMHSWAFVFAETAYPIQLNELTSLPAQGFLWIHLDRQAFETQLALLTPILPHPIHSQHCRDAQNPEHPTFFDAGDGYEIIVWRGIAWSEMQEHPTLHLSVGGTSIATILYPQLLITVSDVNDPNIIRLQDAISQGKLPDIAKPDALLYWFGHMFIEQFLQLRTNLGLIMNKWQQTLLARYHDNYDWNNFLQFKNIIDQLHGWAEDIEDVLQDWRQYNRNTKHAVLSIDVNDLEDHIQRAVKTTEKINTGLDTLIQLHFSSVSHHNNEVLRLLAIFSALFMPLTLITGIFGMNFENMGFLHNDYGYHATLIGMLLIALALLFVFRLKKWL